MESALLNLKAIAEASNKIEDFHAVNVKAKPKESKEWSQCPLLASS